MSGQREDDRRILLGTNLRQRLQIAKLQRYGLPRDDIGLDSENDHHYGQRNEPMSRAAIANRVSRPARRLCPNPAA